MNYFIILPNDIIYIINKNTCIKCHTCKKIYNNNFYKKQNKNYFCSKICYNFI